MPSRRFDEQEEGVKMTKSLRLSWTSRELVICLFSFSNTLVTVNTELALHPRTTHNISAVSKALFSVSSFTSGASSDVVTFNVLPVMWYTPRIPQVCSSRASSIDVTRWKKRKSVWYHVHAFLRKTPKRERKRVPENAVWWQYMRDCREVLLTFVVVKLQSAGRQ